jgi:glycosyltransferase involved in cell wall biosynthesis
VALALAYSAADVFVAPSLLENLPYALMEAAACGTPGVAFASGGVGEIVEHERTGYLARPFDAADLARGMRWLLEDDQRRRELAAAGRRICVERFAATEVARRYLALYRSPSSSP